MTREAVNNNLRTRAMALRVFFECYRNPEEPVYVNFANETQAKNFTKIMGEVLKRGKEIATDERG